MKISWHIFCLALLCLLGPGGGCQAFGDTVTLENGDRLTGVILRLDGGMLILSTEYSDDISIEASKIRSVSTDLPLEVHLASGKVLVGRLKQIEPGAIIIEGTANTRPLPVTWGEVTSINPPRRSWHGSLTLGASVQAGNTERGSASVEGQADWTGNKHRAGLRFLYNYAQEEGNLTARNTYGSLKHDYFLSHSVYSHLGVELLSDEFRDLTLRTVIGPALGYQLWDQDQRSLMFELGASYFSENHKDEEDEQWVTARAAATLTWGLLKVLTLADQLVVYPALQQAGQYQLRNNASITSVITKSWSLKLSNVIEFDSSPPAGVKKADLFWILGLQHSF